MTKRTILAVAVGPPTKDAEFDTAAPNVDNARPYIKGLVDWLAMDPKSDPGPPPQNLSAKACGTDYKIVYRERDVGDLPQAFQNVQPDLVFCMSTSVARAAQTAFPATMPIVAIVSDWQKENLNANVCGVSADRDGHAVRQLQQFKRLSPRSGHPGQSFDRIFVLHRSDYNPSNRALTAIANVASVTTVPVPDTATIQDMENIIRDIPRNDRHGVLVLPADRFFGWATEISTLWTGTMRTFWPTPDLARRPAFGGFGIRQEVCGRYMARVVATIWKNQDDHVALPTGFSPIPGNPEFRPPNPVPLP